jgi:Fe-S cluster biogenesis protein NfuA
MDTQEKIKQKCEQLRAGLQADGGDLELIKVDEAEKKVYVRLHGACVDCPMANQTLKEFVEKALRQVWPDLIEVVREQ